MRVEDVVKELEGARSLTHTMRATPPSTTLLYHVTYICRVPFDEQVVERFKRVHTGLKDMDAVFKRFHRTKKTMEHLPASFLPGYAMDESLLTVNLRACTRENTVYLDLMKEGGKDASLTTWTFKTSPSIAREAEEISQAWAAVIQYIEEHQNKDLLQHPAVLLSYRGDRLLSAYVNRCYLEKTELKWFKLSDLECMDRWKSREDFRKNFLDNIRQFSSQIRCLFQGEADEYENMRKINHLDSFLTPLITT